MPKVQNQHYVPVFYLRNFLSNENKIWVYDKAENKEYPTTNLSNIANERYFYDLEELDISSGEEQYLENRLSKTEDIIAPVLQALIDHLNKGTFLAIDPATRETLCWHLVIQILRTREQREHVGQLVTSLREELIKRGWADEDTLEKYGLNESISSKKHHINFLLSERTRTALYNALSDHIWIIYENNTNTPFYTSDNPIVKQAHLKDPVFSMSGYASEGVEICLPLTPKFVLTLAEKEAFNAYKDLDNKLIGLGHKKHVIYYNALQVTNSYRFVYSVDGNFEHAKALIKDNPWSADPQRKRVEFD